MSRALVAFLGLCLFFSLTSGLHLSPGDLDPLDNIDEDAFEEVFHVLPADNISEEHLREEVLEENEAVVKDTNQAYLDGELTWFDAINEFANLPEDEFEHSKTGAIDPMQGRSFARGLLDPLPEDLVDEASEQHFDQFRMSRAVLPVNYSSVDLGWVSPVKSQGNCGSCVAFASMAAVETCFRKLTGVFGDYAEQEFVDCAYGQNGASGCEGAPPHAYLKWVTDKQFLLAHEAQYPYLNLAPKLTCNASMPVYRQGAKVNSTFYTYSATEDLLKQLVYTYGSVVASVKAAGPLQLYKGGVFAGCNPGIDTDHAINVVGYGTTAAGQDYWLIKNSWGSSWGESGFFRLQRGVGMCGIGQSASVVTCGPMSGTTDPPMTTAKPCVDQYSNCPDLATSSCYQPDIASSCYKSCGLCPGMTPAKSNTCYDTWSSDCPDLAASYCYQSDIASNCKKSCGLCPGMTPAKSNTCYDTYSNCNTLCGTSYKSVCKKACGLC